MDAVHSLSSRTTAFRKPEVTEDLLHDGGLRDDGEDAHAPLAPATVEDVGRRGCSGAAHPTLTLEAVQRMLFHLRDGNRGRACVGNGSSREPALESA